MASTTVPKGEHVHVGHRLLADGRRLLADDLGASFLLHPLGLEQRCTAAPNACHFDLVLGIGLQPAEIHTHRHAYRYTKKRSEHARPV